jgi:hypothetical protein
MITIPKSVVRFRKRVSKTFRSLFGVILFGFALGIAGYLLHESPDHLVSQFGMFLSELGFSFLIAVILFGVFEEWAAREHKKSAIAHIYGMKPDKEVFGMIEKHVLQQRFYRSCLVVTYAFREEKGEDILVEQSTSYEVHNVCSRDDRSELELRGRLDLKPLHTGVTEWDEKLGLESLKVRRKPRPGESTAPDLDGTVPRADIKFEPDDQARVLAYALKKNRDLDFGDALEIEAVHYLVKHDHDSAVWTATIPSTDLEFRVTWDEPIRLKFAFSATHPVLGNLKAEEAPGSRVLKLKTPFLKGHGIHLRWSPEEALPSSHPLPEPAGS